MSPTPVGNLALSELIFELAEHRQQGTPAQDRIGRWKGLWTELERRTSPDLYDLLCVWYGEDEAWICLTAEGEARLWLTQRNRDEQSDDPYRKARFDTTPEAGEALYGIAAEDEYRDR